MHFLCEFHDALKGSMFLNFTPFQAQIKEKDKIIASLGGNSSMDSTLLANSRKSSPVCFFLLFLIITYSRVSFLRHLFL